MATTTNYGWTTPNDTDLVKDGAAAIRTLGSSIDTTVFNNAAAAIPKSTVDAKADLLVGTADNTVGRLAVGTNGHILVADSTVSPTGLKWAAPVGGKLLQVVQATKTDSTTTSSQAFVAAGLQVTITPSSATSKVLILSSFTLTGSSSTQAYYKLVKNTSTDLFIGDAAGSRPRVSGGTFIDNSNYITNGNVMFLDSPATTSSTTYDIYIRAGEANTIGFNRSVTDANTADYGARAAASIIAFEIGA